MNMTHLLIASGILFLAFIILVFYYFRSKHLLDEMWAVKTYDAVELKRMCEDGFDAIVEVQGAVTCDKPLTSLVTQVPCCWFHIVIRREEKRSGVAGVVQDAMESTRRVSEDTQWVTEMDRCYSAVFKVEDKTGYTLVDPTNADIESIESFNGVVSRGESWLERLALGDSDRYHVTEEVFMPTGYAYVLGQASSGGDDILIHYPEKGYIDPNKRFFVISRKTEKELTIYKQITVNVCLWFGVVALLGSIFFLLEGLGIVQVL